VLTIMSSNTQKRLLFLLDALASPGNYYPHLRALGDTFDRSTNIGCCLIQRLDTPASSQFSRNSSLLRLFISMITIDYHRLATTGRWFQKLLSLIAIFLVNASGLWATFSPCPLIIFPLCAIAIIPFLPGERQKRLWYPSFG